MKKVAVWLTAIMLVSSMTVPAYAYSGNISKTSSSSGWFSMWERPASGGSGAAVKATPVIKEAKFYHSGYVASMKNRLQIRWDEVDGAKRYEIQVTKADGSKKTYTATGNTLVVKDSQCPRTYSEKLGLWESATVRVRAVTSTGTGNWSQAVAIGCDQVH
jgi:hypothetical protein